MHKLKLIVKYLFLLAICFPFLSFSQSDLQNRMACFYSQIDSLKQQHKHLKLDFNSGNFAKDSLLEYYQDLNITDKASYKGFNDAQNIYWLYEKGLLQISLGIYDKATETFKLALDYIDDDNEADRKAKVFIQYYLSDAYRALGMVNKSNEEFLSILQMPLVQSDSLLQYQIKLAVSENYEAMGDYEEAMALCIEQYNYNLRTGGYRIASYNLIQMGRIAANIEMDTSYFEYYHMANELAVKHGDSARLSNNLVNLGMAYRNAGFPVMGLKYLKQAEHLSKYQRIYGRTHLLLALSSAYASVDSLDEAIDIAHRAREDALKINVFNLINQTDNMLSDYYKRIGRLDSAKVYLNNCINNRKLIDKGSSSQQLYKQLSDLSILMNDYPKAMAYLDSSYIEYERFARKTNHEKLVELRERSDYYIHKNRIIELVSKNKLEHERNLRLIYTVIGIILALGLSIYFVFNMRKRLKEIRESYLLLVKKSIEQDKLNTQLRACELKHKGKSKSNIISGEELIIKELEKQIFEDEVYKNPQLSLKYLADSLNTNTSYLSAIINSHYNCNFRTFINKYRIDKARNMLVSPKYKQYSMEGISMEVGFKSRTVFYQSFKSITGLSPSLYIKNYKIATSES